jgi:hypothetical protein
MAHALEKPVVLITSDPVEQAPADVGAFEFISYSTLEPDRFLDRLGLALRSVIGNRYAAAYPEALGLFQEFCAAKNRNRVPVTKDQFIAVDQQLGGAGQRLVDEPGRARAELLVRRLLGLEPPIEVLADLKDWLDQKYP